MCLPKYISDKFDTISHLNDQVFNAIEDLFGDTAVMFKVHLIRHIPECIHYLGPLKLHWCFAIKNLLSFVYAMVFGWLQMDYLLIESIHHYSLLKAFEGYNNTTLDNPTTLLYWSSTLKLAPVESDNNKTTAFLLGSIVTSSTVALQRMITQLQSLFVDVQDKSLIQVFKRAQINDVMFHSLLYKRPVCKQSHYVEVLIDDQKHKDIHPLVLVKSHIGVITAFLQYKKWRFAAVRLFRNIGVHSDEMFRIISREPNEDTLLVDLSQIVQKCIIITPDATSKYALDDPEHQAPAQKCRETQFNIVYFE